MDVLTREQRTKCMSRIRQKNTGPEIRLRKELWKRGARYHLATTMLGKPDIVYCGPKVAVFVDGCFWHKCPIHYVEPRSNREYWVNKINRNVARDHDVTLALQSQGWIVVRVWEHEIEDSVGAVADRIVQTIRHAHCVRHEPTGSKGMQ